MHAGPGTGIRNRMAGNKRKIALQVLRAGAASMGISGKYTV